MEGSIAEAQIVWVASYAREVLSYQGRVALDVRLVTVQAKVLVDQLFNPLQICERLLPMIFGRLKA